MKFGNLCWPKGVFSHHHKCNSFSWTYFCKMGDGSKVLKWTILVLEPQEHGSGSLCFRKLKSSKQINEAQCQGPKSSLLPQKQTQSPTITLTSKPQDWITGRLPGSISSCCFYAGQAILGGWLQSGFSPGTHVFRKSFDFPNCILKRIF